MAVRALRIEDNPRSENWQIRTPPAGGRTCFWTVLFAICAPVQDLIRKIEADAEARLPISANADAAERLSRCKGFLKVETHRLKLWHRGGAGGHEICRARAAMLDALLRHLWGSAHG